MKKAIIAITSALVGSVFGAGGSIKFMSKKVKRQQELAEKHFTLYYLMTKWVWVKQEGKCLSEYFVQKGYKRIAIYGMNYVGETLLNELRNTDIQIIYGIDENAADMKLDICTITPDEKLKEVDVIVVTPVSFFDSIEEMLKKKVDCPIVSIEDVLYEC